MIARRRKRPRVASCSFRTLGWLIRREAAWCIYANASRARAGAPAHVVWAKLTTQQATRLAEQLIRDDPGRRYYP